jgi:hypothetical protein
MVTRRKTPRVPHDTNGLSEYAVYLSESVNNAVMHVEYVGQDGGSEPVKLTLTAGDIRALLERHGRDRYTNLGSDDPPGHQGDEPSTNLTLTYYERGALVLCAEEEHRSMLRMTEIKSDPVWAKYAAAWASLRRKLTGTDELT